MASKRLNLLLAAVLTPLTISNIAHGQAATEHTHAKAPVSTELKIIVDGKSTTLTLAALAAMPQKTLTVHNVHTRADEIYTGVALGELLAKNGFAAGQPTHRKMPHSYIKAEGTDAYWVLFSTTEVEGSEHNADVIIATSMNGKAFGDDGR